MSVRVKKEAGDEERAVERTGARPPASERIEAARWYLVRAHELLARGDPYDAAEKAWAAVKAATEALTRAVLGAAEPPGGWGWRRFVREAFARAGLSEGEAEELAAYYIEARDRLHGACFYGLIYEEAEHRPLLEKAEWYLDSVARALGRAGRGSSAGA